MLRSPTWRVAQWRQFATVRTFYRYAVQHLRAAFPTLPAHSQYNRLVRRGHDALVAVGQHLAALRDGRTRPYDALDGNGSPHAHSPAAGHRLAGQAHIGRCNEERANLTWLPTLDQTTGCFTSVFNGRAWWCTGHIMGMTVTNLVPPAEGDSAEEAAINDLLMRHQR